MSKYRLVYFNARGRAECIRWVFEFAGIEYEDYRFDRNNMEQFRKDFPFGQVPVLEIKNTGFKMCQQFAITRYLSRKYAPELAGGDDLLQQARVDMIADCIEDFEQALVPIRFEPDQQIKETNARTFEKEKVDYFMSKFEQFLENNSEHSQYFVGKSVTWADFVFVNAISWCVNVVGVHIPFEKYPRSKTEIDLVEKIPAIARWIQRRPVTPS